MIYSTPILPLSRALCAGSRNLKSHLFPVYYSSNTAQEKSHIFRKAELYWYVLLISALFMTSSCSFHLRGVDELPRVLSPIAVVCKNVSPSWNSILRKRLRTANLNVVDTPADARYWVLIQNEDIQKNIMSISSGSSSRQYQLIYKVTFSLNQTKGKTLILEAPLLASRLLTINNDRILGSHDEEEKIMDDIRQDIATQIIYRLATLARTLPIQKQGKS